VLSDGAVSSLGVTVDAPIQNGKVELQVLRGTNETTVVFDRVFHMTDLSVPASPPEGAVARSTWSGTLSPSDWAGGCQHDQYKVSISVVASDTNAPFMSSSAPWFWCK
jgi:hypothetical protein